MKSAQIHPLKNAKSQKNELTHRIRIPESYCAG
jgi:hypothetical protein